MSFGKNPQVRSAVGSFRQVSQQFTKNTYSKKKGGGPPYFVDMFQPPMNEVCLVRLVPGEYLQDQVVEHPVPGKPDEVEYEVIQTIMPFIKFVDHFDGQKQRGGICSGGALMNVKNKRQPCHGCDIYWATAARQANGRFESNRMSRQNKYSFSVFDYSLYHKLEQYDRETGQVRMNSQNQPYWEWVRCQHPMSWAVDALPPQHQRSCDACRANRETKQGHASHWPINYTQLQSLRSAESNIGHSCVTCGVENCIISLGWMCGSCGECVVDMSTTQLKKDELLKLTDDAYGCGACGNKAFLKEVYECRSCAPRGQTGVRASLFDVDLKVMLAPGGANNSKVLQVSGWSPPHPIAQHFAEVAKPLDLVARYAPMPLEAQAALFGVVPGVPAGGQQAPQGQPQQRQPQPGGSQFGQQYAPQGQQWAQQPQGQYAPPPQQPQYAQQPMQQPAVPPGYFGQPAQPPMQQQPAQQYAPQPGAQPAPQYANPYGPRPAES